MRTKHKPKLNEKTTKKELVADINKVEEAHNQVEDVEEQSVFPVMSPADSLFHSSDTQLPLLKNSSIFSNFPSDELFFNNEPAFSRQGSLFVKPLILYQEERVPNDKRDEGKS